MEGRWGLIPEDEVCVPTGPLCLWERLRCTHRFSGLCSWCLSDVTSVQDALCGDRGFHPSFSSASSTLPLQLTPAPPRLPCTPASTLPPPPFCPTTDTAELLNSPLSPQLPAQAVVLGPGGEQESEHGPCSPCSQARAPGLGGAGLSALSRRPGSVGSSCPQPEPQQQSPDRGCHCRDDVAPVRSRPAPGRRSSRH